MNKLKQILEFIRALLGFLLNLKKKKTDEKNEKPHSRSTDKRHGTSLLLRGMGADCIRDGDVFMGSLNGC